MFKCSLCKTAEVKKENDDCDQCNDYINDLESFDPWYSGNKKLNIIREYDYFTHSLTAIEDRRVEAELKAEERARESKSLS